jgi:hypothetical protein
LEKLRLVKLYESFKEALSRVPAPNTVDDPSLQLASTKLNVLMASTP